MSNNIELKKDTYFNNEMLKRIKKSLLAIENGESKTISSALDIKKLLGLNVNSRERTQKNSNSNND